MASSTSTIRFSLLANRLGGQDSSPYRALVRSYKTVNQEAMIEDMAAMNASVSRQEILVVLDLMKAVIKRYLLSGFRVKTDLFSAKLSVTGGFDTEEDEFDPDRHSVHVRMAPAADIRKSVAHNARMERMYADEPLPKLYRVYDFESETRNGTVTPGHLAEMKGANLDYDRDDNAQGVYFADSANALFKAETVHRLHGTNVLFKVPELAPGTYRLIMRRAFGAEIREGVLKAEVSVN